ncbi:MAG: metalloregulator ArsR/SmtB family transcription factor [Nocardioidaceae bacterium]
MDSSAVSPDPSGLKALAHPVRLRMLGMLRIEGPATATTLAERLGLNTGATSYHLRQLAQHGFIADDPGLGNGRERWWRAAHQSTRTQGDGGDPEAMSAYVRAVAVMYAEQQHRALDERPFLPEDWSRASTISDWAVRLTPQRARALLKALVAVVEAEPDEPEDTEGAAPFVVQLSTFPLPGQALS